MRALSVKQPWASLIASGRKTVELRSWSTSYRGPLLIVSGLRFDAERGAWLPDGPRGVALCVVRVLDVRPATPADSGAACVEVGAEAGLFAWVLGSPEPVEPIAVKGKLGLFTV